MKIDKFNKQISTGEISYDDVSDFATDGNDEVHDALWKAWTEVRMDLLPYADGTDKECENHMTRCMSKREFLYRCTGREDTIFYNELAVRVQVYYCHYVDIFMMHTEEQEGLCEYSLKKGEVRTHCTCGRNVSERMKRLQTALGKF